jgi:chemotaxis protein CheD
MLRATKISKVFLQPGEYFVGNSMYRITTLLGSCVSVTIWHPRAKIGAMSHFLLPSRGGTPAQEADGRYGDEAIWLMLNDLQERGVKPSQCQAKVFGGGDMFPHLGAKDEQSVGKKNGVAARAILDSHGIPVVSASLFGEGYRRIIFDVSNGHVWSRQTPVQNALPIRARHYA